MNTILLSKLTQKISGWLFWVFAAIAGFCGHNVQTVELTSSVEFVATFLASCFFAGINRVINAARTTEPPAEKYHGPTLIVFLLLPGLLAMTGCGVDKRVVRGAKQTSAHVENAKKNSGALTSEVAHAYELEAKAHIDTKFRWDAEKVVTQAKANPSITAQQIVEEMVFKTFKRDEHRATVENQVKKVNVAQGVVDKDLNNALRINDKVLEYVSEPGFDLIAFIQGIFGKKEDELPPSPAGNNLPAEIITIPLAADVTPAK